jgi:D-alanyl-D-alanine carboxypeptidase
MKWVSERMFAVFTKLSAGYVFLGMVLILATGCSIDEDSSRTVTTGVKSETATISISTPYVLPTQEKIETFPEASATPEPIATKKPKPPPPTPTPIPTSTQIPTPTKTATATVIPSPTKAGRCSDRIPADELLTLVTSEYAISADYVPGDLVYLSNFLSTGITRGYNTQLRRIAVPSLLQMIADMQREGLAPEIISGYRSYSAQAVAWRKWLEREPDRASIISVSPGHSEHQLGTTVDFGSPELAAIVGSEDIEFHTYFYKTREGEWLENNAHEYGFSLSYPLEAFEITGFYYEPWHYRYIGVELASELKTKGVSLTQYLLETYPPPCDQ